MTNNYITDFIYNIVCSQTMVILIIDHRKRVNAMKVEALSTEKLKRININNNRKLDTCTQYITNVT